MLFWIPACAGMTAGLLPTLFLESEAAARFPVSEPGAPSAASKRRICFPHCDGTKTDSSLRGGAPA
jgi:hypothetical protein